MTVLGFKLPASIQPQPLECDLEPVILGQLELNEELHRKHSERVKKAAETRKINKEKKRIQDDFNDKRWIGELF